MALTLTAGAYRATDVVALVPASGPRRLQPGLHIARNAAVAKEHVVGLEVPVREDAVSDAVDRPSAREPVDVG